MVVFLNGEHYKILELIMKRFVRLIIFKGV